MIFWFFIVIFSILFIASLVLYDEASLKHRTKFEVSAIIFVTLLVGTFAVSFKPVKTNEYTVKLSDSLVYKEEEPFDSMDVHTDTYFSKGDYLEFSSYSQKGYLPDDKVRTRNEDVPIRFKKGTKNCIHYKKEVNIFGDESKYADNIVVEYDAKNVKKAKEEKTNELSNTSNDDVSSSSNDLLNGSEVN